MRQKLNTVTCEYPLPNPDHQDTIFQTRGFGKPRVHYSITQDGYLIEKDARAHRKMLHDMDRRRRQRTRELPSATGTRIEYHGDFFFDGIWRGERVGYAARFDRGIVKWIRRKNILPPLGTTKRLLIDIQSLSRLREETFLAVFERLNVSHPEFLRIAVDVFDGRGPNAHELAMDIFSVGWETFLKKLEPSKRREALRSVSLYGFPYLD